MKDIEELKSWFEDDKLYVGEYVFTLAIMVGEKRGGFVESYEIVEGGLLGVDMTTDYLEGLLFEDIENADRLGTLLNKATGQDFSIIRIPKERVLEE